VSTTEDTSEEGAEAIERCVAGVGGAVELLTNSKKAKHSKFSKNEI